MLRKISVASSVLGNQGENRVSCDPANTMDILPAVGPWRGESEQLLRVALGNVPNGMVTRISPLNERVLDRWRNKMMGLVRLKEAAVRAAAVSTEHWGGNPLSQVKKKKKKVSESKILNFPFIVSPLPLLPICPLPPPFLHRHTCGHRYHDSWQLSVQLRTAST